MFSCKPLMFKKNKKTKKTARQGHNVLSFYVIGRTGDDVTPAHARVSPQFRARSSEVAARYAEPSECMRQ